MVSGQSRSTNSKPASVPATPISKIFTRFPSTSTLRLSRYVIQGARRNSKTHAHMSPCQMRFDSKNDMPTAIWLTNDSRSCAETSCGRRGVARHCHARTVRPTGAMSAANLAKVVAEIALRRVLKHKKMWLRGLHISNHTCQTRMVDCHQLVHLASKAAPRGRSRLHLPLDHNVLRLARLCLHAAVNTPCSIGINTNRSHASREHLVALIHIDQVAMLQHLRRECNRLIRRRACRAAAVRGKQACCGSHSAMTSVSRRCRSLSSCASPWQLGGGGGQPQ